MVEWALLVSVWSLVLVELAECLRRIQQGREWRAFMEEMKAAGTQLGVQVADVPSSYTGACS
jgi:hypothetical protein